MNFLEQTLAGRTLIVVGIFIGIVLGIHQIWSLVFVDVAKNIEIETCRLNLNAENWADGITENKEGVECIASNAGRVIQLDYKYSASQIYLLKEEKCDSEFVGFDPGNEKISVPYDENSCLFMSVVGDYDSNAVGCGTFCFYGSIKDYFLVSESIALRFSHNDSYRLTHYEDIPLDIRQKN